MTRENGQQRYPLQIAPENWQLGFSKGQTAVSFSVRVLNNTLPSVSLCLKPPRFSHKASYFRGEGVRERVGKSKSPNSPFETKKTLGNDAFLEKVKQKYSDPNGGLIHGNCHPNPMESQSIQKSPSKQSQIRFFC